jgi:glycosyltransferase involved in cell wall biosynthesis
MRITFLSPYSKAPQGGVKIIYEYANQLTASGHQVTVVHVRGREQRSPNTMPNWFRLDRRVRLLFVEDCKPDDLPNGDAIFFYDDKLPPEKGHRFTLIQGYGVFETSVEKAIFRAPIKKVCVSRWLVEHGLMLGVPSEELVHIPNGIDHEKYQILTPIESRPPRIAMHYVHDRSLPIKGGQDGMVALELVRRYYKNIDILLFGVRRRPDGLAEYFQYQCNPGQETLVNTIYNGSSIYVCPSWLEGFGLPGAEAMACGCALVTTDTGGSRDYAEHEVTALVSQPKRPELLAENILRLLDDDELRRKLAQAGHERIQYFTWQRSAAALEQLIINELTQKDGITRDI